MITIISVVEWNKYRQNINVCCSVSLQTDKLNDEIPKLLSLAEFKIIT